MISPIVPKFIPDFDPIDWDELFKKTSFTDEATPELPRPIEGRARQ
jgi:hypothetical protein